MEYGVNQNNGNSCCDDPGTCQCANGRGGNQEIRMSEMDQSAGPISLGTPQNICDCRSWVWCSTCTSPHITSIVLTVPAIKILPSHTDGRADGQRRTEGSSPPFLRRILAFDDGYVAAWKESTVHRRLGQDEYLTTGGSRGGGKGTTSREDGEP